MAEEKDKEKTVKEAPAAAPAAEPRGCAGSSGGGARRSGGPIGHRHGGSQAGSPSSRQGFQEHSRRRGPYFGLVQQHGRQHHGPGRQRHFLEQWRALWLQRLAQEHGLCGHRHHAGSLQSGAWPRPARSQRAGSGPRLRPRVRHPRGSSRRLDHHVGSRHHPRAAQWLSAAQTSPRINQFQERGNYHG